MRLSEYRGQRSVMILWRRHSDMFRLATAGSVDDGKSTPSIVWVSQ
jgi:hypothetical protein